MEDWLLQQKTPKNEIDAYKKATKLCIDQNFVEFRGNYYKQTNGVAMGNPISSFIANLFMCRFETELSKHKNFPRMWYRYVDDIICIVNKRKVEETLNWLNSIHQSIKFTHEIEDENGKIPFLDINIERTEENKLQFSIYRKPTSTQRYIPQNSHHSTQHKRATFNAMIHRLLHIPMNKSNYDEELKNINTIADTNGYSEDFVMHIYKKMKKQYDRFSLTTHRPEKRETKYVSIEYVPPITNKMRGIFRKHNIELITKSSKKLNTLTCKQKDSTTKLDKSGIYEIKCDNCDMKYIGQTRRKLKTRYKEHHNATTKQNTEMSAVADHMKEKHHSFNINNISLIHQCYDRRRLDVLESIEIYKAEGELMNAEKGPIQSNLFKYVHKK